MFRSNTPILQRLSTVLTAGAIGGLFNSLAVWLFGLVGLTIATGVQIQPSFTPEWLYPRLVWGGIWGMLFIIPVLTDRLILKGLLLSLGPALVQCLVVFPFKAQKGWFGFELGTLTPVYVIIFNAVWGIAAGLWILSAFED